MAFIDLEFDIPISNDEDFGIMDVVSARAERGMQSILLILIASIKEKLNQPGSGHIYRRRGRTHQASAPGEPPAPDTGQYKDSWQVYFQRRSKSFFLGGIGTTLWETFGRRLELGGSDKRGIYIAPRPHVRPAVDEVEEEIESIILGITV